MPITPEVLISMLTPQSRPSVVAAGDFLAMLGGGSRPPSVISTADLLAMISAPVTPQAVDILSAVRILNLAGPTAPEMDLFTKAAADGDRLPYAIVEERSATKEASYDDADVFKVILGFRVYAPDLDLAGALGDELWAWLAGKSPTFAGPLGVSAMIPESDPKHGRLTGRVVGQADAWYQDREARVRVVRSK